MKKWEIENLEKSEISEKLFRVFLFSSFQSFPTAKIQSSDLKISEKNSRDFRGFQVFELAPEVFRKKSVSLVSLESTLLKRDSNTDIFL